MQNNKNNNPTNKKVDKKKRRKIILVSALSGALLITGGIYGYNYYQDHKAIGTDNVKLVNENKSFNYKDLITTSRKDKDRGYSFLFESKVKPVNNKKAEFKPGAKFTRNLMDLMQSGNKDDINQGAALWTRNSRNFAFSKDKNLFAAGIGKDMLVYNRYLELISGMSATGATSYTKEMGKSIKETFTTPMSMALIGGQLLPVAQAEFLEDGRSAMVNFSYTGLRYAKNIQLNSAKEAGKAGEYYDGNGDKYNVAARIWAGYSDTINSLYEVHLTTPDKFKETVAYIIEDTTGQLTFYGFYTKEPSQGLSLSKYIEQNAQIENIDEANENDITWNTFVKETS